MPYYSALYILSLLCIFNSDKFTVYIWKDKCLLLNIWPLGSNSIWSYNPGSSFADTKEGRYNPKMYPVIPVHNWRKGSQVMVFFSFFLNVNIMKNFMSRYFWL